MCKNSSVYKLHKCCAVTLIISILFCFFLFFSSFAYAEMPVSLYKKAKDSEDMQSYVTGVGRGIFWTNSILVAQERKPLFCLPKKLALDQKVIISLLEQELRNPTAYSDDTPVELVLVMSFITRFPCSE